MTLGTIGRWLRPCAAAILLAYGVSVSASASDNPPQVVAAPQVVAGAPCQTCGPLPAACASGKCGHAHHKHCKHPYVTTLCPGACFGYFQTQWNRWEDVCPHPYQGIGISDAPRPATPSTTQPMPLTPPAKVPMGEPKLPNVDPKLPTLDPKKGGLPQPLPLPVPGKN